MENEFARKIKRQRQNLDLSLRKVCDVVFNDGKKISVSYLNDIEQGHRKPPSGKIVVQLANILQLDPQELLNLASKVDPIIEDVISKHSNVGYLFRQIAETYKDNPGIIDHLNKELRKKSDNKE